MSLESAKKFQKDLMENEELKASIEKAMEAYKDSGKKEKELLPEVAKEFGYEFTEEELTTRELDVDELANVAGGIFWLDDDAPDGHEATCFTCYYYRGMDDYYYSNHICKVCGANDTINYYAHDTGAHSQYCKVCGRLTDLPEFSSWL